MTFDVANQMASSGQRRAVLLLCLAVCGAAVLALPVASVRLPAMPHIASVYGASAAMIDLATFWLLMSAHRPTRAIRIVASAYLFAGLMALLHMLTFPGALLTDASVLGNGNTVSWLFIAWRAGFPVFILWAVACEIGVARKREGRLPPTGVAVLLVAASLLLSLAASDVPALVPGPDGQLRFSMPSAVGAYIGGVVCCATLGLMLHFGLARRSLYLWLMLVLVSETVGVWFSTFSGGRYTVAWYSIRAEGLSASAIVLVLLATHFRELQARLSTTVVELSERTDALQAEIQHREHAERMLAQSQKLEAVGQLAAGLAHDLNNYMQVVGIRAELIRRRFGEPVEPDVAMIQRNVRKAEHLTRQLLMFAGRRPLQPQAVRLQHTLPEFLDAFAPMLRDKAAVRLEVPDDAWPVRVDPTELEIALANLLTNARDSMAPGGEVVIRVANLPAQGARGERVAVEVRDDGRGIDAATLERVFEPFFTTKAPGRGSGLGLSQVYAFVRGSDGDIAIDSEVGRGTTVRLALPRDAGTQDDEPSDATLAAAPAGAVVLLVDDNADVLEATSALLQQAGLVVKTAGGAPEALTLLDAGLKPDVLLSDIVMGSDMDGVGLAQQAQRRQPGLRVVLATGYSAAATDARDQGFTVLRKPYDATLLLQSLRG